MWLDALHGLRLDVAPADNIDDYAAWLADCVGGRSFGSLNPADDCILADQVKIWWMGRSSLMCTVVRGTDGVVSGLHLLHAAHKAFASDNDGAHIYMDDIHPISVEGLLGFGASGDTSGENLFLATGS